MAVQFILVGTIVCSALALTIIRLFRFFKAPVSKCGGCSGCGLKGMTKDE